jgi:predicted nuclease of predicted toxin-antitoxin system
MRLLAGENFPKPTVELLRAGGHDVLWARTDCPGWKDHAPLELAESQGRIMLTLDRVFWQISIQRRPPLKRSGVVLFRLHPATADKLEPLVRTFAAAGKEWAAHISMVTPEAIQMLSSSRS